MAKTVRAIILAAVILSVLGGRAEASFHLWSISEVYSDVSGTIQFIELSCPAGADGENFLSGHTIVASQGASTHTFTFPGNTPSNTGGKKLLIATAGYAALAGAAVPDYTIPSGFLFRPDGTVNYGEGISIVSYANMPADSITSLNYPGATTATNTPTNFAGTTGPVPPQPIADPLPAIAKGNVTIEIQTIVSGLTSPLGLAVPDDRSDRMFLYDQTGAINTILNGELQATVLLNVSGRMVGLSPSYDERGLLGMACHPDFANNPKFYTYTSEPAGGTADFTNPGSFKDHEGIIAEWTMTGGDPNATTANTGSRREIMRIDHPAGNHNGGTIRFGPDGFLYIGIGDGGGGDDQGGGHSAGGNGQDKNNVYGKILRIDPDKSSGAISANGQYSVPATNPFVGAAGLDEIFVYGLRNPFSFSFDSGLFTPGSSRLYIGDVGQNRVEEVDLVASGDIGANLGWPVREGAFYFNNNGNGPGFVTFAPPTPFVSGLTDPIAQYDHGDGISVIGGFVCRSGRLPGLGNTYVFSDLNGRIFYLDGANAVKEARIGLDDRGLQANIKGFGEDANGDLYICTSKNLGPSGATGALVKLISPASSARNWMLFR